MIGISEMYSASHKMTPYGVEGYEIEKKYELTAKGVLKDKNDKESKQEQKKRETKRGNYLEDYAKIYGSLPGPGVYDYPNGNWTIHSKHSSKKVVPSKKLTYIDEIIEREKKDKRPAPGQYKLFKDDQDIKNQKKRLAHKKTSFTDRMTYLDGIQYEASTTPGVGSYNPSFQRPKSATTVRKKKTIETIRPQSGFKKREKTAEIGSYNPRLLEDHKSFSKKNKGYSQWGKTQRFKGEKKGSNLGPGAYIKGDQDTVAVRKGSKSVYY